MPTTPTARPGKLRARARVATRPHEPNIVDFGAGGDNDGAGLSSNRGGTEAHRHRCVSGETRDRLDRHRPSSSSSSSSSSSKKAAISPPTSLVSLALLVGVVIYASIWTAMMAMHSSPPPSGASDPSSGVRSPFLPPPPPPAGGGQKTFPRRRDGSDAGRRGGGDVGNRRPSSDETDLKRRRWTKRRRHVKIDGDGDGGRVEEGGSGTRHRHGGRREEEEEGEYEDEDDEDKSENHNGKERHRRGGRERRQRSRRTRGGSLTESRDGRRPRRRDERGERERLRDRRREEEKEEEDEGGDRGEDVFPRASYRPRLIRDDCPPPVDFSAMLQTRIYHFAGQPMRGEYYNESDSGYVRRVERYKDRGRRLSCPKPNMPKQKERRRGFSGTIDRDGSPSEEEQKAEVSVASPPIPWQMAIDDKLGAHLFCLHEGVKVPRMLFCTGDGSKALEKWDQPSLPPGGRNGGGGGESSGGFVIKRRNGHSSSGIHVFPNGYNFPELLSKKVKSKQDVVDHYEKRNVSDIFVEEIVQGPTLGEVPYSYRFFMFDGVVGGVQVEAHDDETSDSDETYCEYFVDEHFKPLSGPFEVVCLNFTRAGEKKRRRPQRRYGDGNEEGSCSNPIAENADETSTEFKYRTCAPFPPPRSWRGLVRAAKKLSRRIGIFCRIDLYESASGEVVLGEFSPYPRDGKYHCMAKYNAETGCLDPCHLGRMWRDTNRRAGVEGVREAGMDVPAPEYLREWKGLSTEEQCRRISEFGRG